MNNWGNYWDLAQWLVVNHGLDHRLDFRLKPDEVDKLPFSEFAQYGLIYNQSEITTWGMGTRSIEVTLYAPDEELPLSAWLDMLGALALNIGVLDEAETTRPANTIGFKKLSPIAIIPTRAHETDAGLDLYAAAYAEIEVGETAAISTDIAVDIPPGYYGQICTRSSMAKQGLFVVGGVIDSGYTGEIKVLIHNTGDPVYCADPGDKIAQLVILPIHTGMPVEVQEIKDTSRGDAGFGSTGK